MALGDDALVLSHRLGEWAGHAPVLEEEVALANIALDLLGQARFLYSLAGDEDELAYLREERAFRNVQLVERPNGDFASTIARQLYFSTYQEPLYRELAASDSELAPLAAKAVKEVAYHRDHAEQWTLRLGDGTRGEPPADAGRPGRPVALHRRTVRSVEGLATSTETLRDPWLASVGEVIAEATLTQPAVRTGPAGRPERGARGSTPSRSGGCSPRCSTFTARTRGRHGDRRSPPWRRSCAG